MANDTCGTNHTGVHLEVNSVLISKPCSEVYASSGTSVKVPISPRTQSLWLRAKLHMNS